MALACVPPPAIFRVPLHLAQLMLEPPRELNGPFKHDNNSAFTLSLYERKVAAPSNNLLQLFELHLQPNTKLTSHKGDATVGAGLVWPSLQTTQFS